MLEQADVNSRVSCFTDVESSVNETRPTCVHEGLTPLFLAYLNRHWKTAELLLVLGADANIADTNGNTVLHFLLSGNALKTDQLEKGWYAHMTSHDLLC